MKKLLSLPCATVVTLLIVMLMSTEAQQVTITVYARDGGGTVSGGGSYTVGATVTVHGVCQYGTHFSGWWDPAIGHVSSATNYTFLATVNRDLYASFCYYVEATANPDSGGIAVGSEPEYGYSATATAVPYSGWHFLNWTEGGTVVSSNASYAFSTSSDRSLVANFNTKPTLTTTAPSGITATGATAGGNITSDGGDSVTARGVCWSMAHNPTTADSHTSNGAGAGAFTGAIGNCALGTLYYVRAYATNSAGIAYGNERSFTTLTAVVSPSNGPFAGGNRVVVTNAPINIGSGIDNDITNIAVGGIATTNILDQGTNWVSFVAPPAGSTGVQSIVIQSTSAGVTTLTNAYTYNPAGWIGTTGDWTRWEEVEGLPSARYLSAAGVLNGALYVVGGSDGSPKTNLYRFNGTNWTEIIGLPVALQGAGVDALNNKLYSVGGRNSSANAVRNVYGFDGTNGAGLAGLPAARYSAGVGVLNGRLYYAGGFSSTANTNVYGFDGTNWTEARGLPVARTEPAAGVLNGALYIAGGYDESFVSKTNVYGFDGTNWTEATGLPAARYGSASGVLSNRFYNIGGISSGITAATNVYCFDGTNWTEAAGLPADRARLSAGVLNGELYAIGGINSDGVSQTNVYRYPTLTASSGVSPFSGSWTGGYRVAISGTNLCDGTLGDVTNVTLCGANVASIESVAGSTQIVVIAGAASPGLGAVRVYSVNYGETIKSGAFTYTQASMHVLGTNGAEIASAEAASAEKGTDFGRLSWGASLTNTFAITNSGNEPLAISGVTTSGSGAAAFSISDLGFSIDAGAVSNFTIRFAPSAAGSYTAAVTIANNSTNASYAVNLKGSMADAAAWYVDAAMSDDTGAGTNWATAKKIIQSAVDLAVNNGDTVWVTNGAYSLGGATAPGYALTNRVCITNAITLRSVNGAAATVIRGSGGPGGDAAVRGVYLANGASISGFTITDGRARTTGYGDRNAGGIYLSSSCVVRDCIVVSNQTFWDGGGVYLYNGGTVSNCILSKNVSSYFNGGGAYLDNGGTINNCILDENNANEGGAAFIYLAGVLNNCLLSGNVADSGNGGGIYFYTGGTLNNCTLYGNTAAGEGGGLYRGSGGAVNNCIVWGNSAHSSPYNVAGYNGSVSYTCAGDGVTHGSGGNITNTPLFMASDDFRLAVGSPCIDTGNNAYAPTNVTPYDLAGNPRIINDIVDMGAYERQISPGCVVLGTNGAAISSGEAASAAKGTDFGSLAWGSALTNTFAITNNGNTNLTISGVTTSGSGAAAFSISDLGFSIDPGAVSNFTIRFAPSAAGSYTAAVAIANGSTTTPYIVYLAGTGSKHDQAALTFSPASPQTYNTTNVLSAGGGSGTGALSYAVESGPGEIEGSTNLKITSGTGMVTVVATKAADDNYNAISATGTVACAMADQTIAFPAIPDQTVTSVVTLTATASSGLPVRNFAIVSGPGIITTNRVTLHTPSAHYCLSFTGTGIVVVSASQGGNADWNAAPTVTNRVWVTNAAPVDKGSLAVVILPAEAVAAGAQWRVNGGAWRVSGTIVTGLATGAHTVNYSIVPGYTNPADQNVTVSTNQLAAVQGIYRLLSGDEAYNPISADYDGDQVADPAICRPATGLWLVRFSGIRYQWGRMTRVFGPGGYAPVAADFDGDRLADPGLYNTTNGEWRAMFSSADYKEYFVANLLGDAGCTAMAADFDGDGLADPAVYNPATGDWKVRLSSGGYLTFTAENLLGRTGFAASAGDIDGDRLADPFVCDMATGQCMALLSSAGYYRVETADEFLGVPEWLLALADYDDDGKADPAIYDPSTGTLVMRLSRSNYQLVVFPVFLKP